MPRGLIGARRWRVGLGDWVSALAGSPDGALVAAGSLAGDAVILDAGSGDAIAKLGTHPLGVLAMGWSPDGGVLAVGGQDGVVACYDRHGERVQVVEGDGWVADLAWNPKPSSTGEDALAFAAGKSLTLVGTSGANRRYDEVSSTITAVAWSPNGRRVGAASYGGVSWYDPETVPESSPARHYRWKGSLLSLVIAPSGRWACAGAQDSTIQLWRLWSGDDLSMSSYPAKIEHLAFSDDSHWMASACLGEITVWNFGGRGPKGTRPATAEAHSRHVTALAWQPGGDVLASGGADGQVLLWPAPTRQGQALRPLAADGGADAVSSLTWTRSGDAVICGWGDGTVELRPVG